MKINLYNSLSNTIEELSFSNNELNLYVCGPTVYNYIHIGNARPVVFFDIFKKYLEFCGIKVNYCSNITDIDDKIINKALNENKTESEIASFYEQAYFEDLEKLNSSKPDIITRCTDYIDQIILYINQLIEKDYAYVKNGDVYFRVSKLNDYGILSNQNTDQLLDGVRIENNIDKENQLDFTLWKKTQKGITYKSPFSDGRPGWHTECVVMINSIFGNNLNIHGGGMDLKFPHHENEIAQHKALNNSNLADCFIHVGRLDYNGSKMSKSLGNVLLVRDFDTIESLMSLRMILAFSNYRLNLSYTDELYQNYNKIYNKFRRTLSLVYFELKINGIKSDEVNILYLKEFKDFMNDDYNTQNVLTLFDKIIKEMNIILRSEEVNYNDLIILYNTFNMFNSIFSINYNLNITDDDVRSYALWKSYRNDGDFDHADKIKERLLSKNIII